MTARRYIARLFACLGIVFAALAAADEDEPIELWHTFSADSIEERLLTDAVDAFREAHPEIAVQVTRIPYLQNLPQFINSSQGGEAPDVIRVSDTEVGKIGHISVEGLPLLEDLRPHLTPMQRSRLESRAVRAMRYDQALYAIPVSQGCLALVYNKALFDAANLDYPNDRWTTDDMIQAAKVLSRDGVMGVALPLKWSYWFIPFQTGFGGRPFDDDGNPTLDSPGTAEAMDWFLDLEREHGIVASSVSLEAMSTQFQLGKAAMVLDGPWNWNSYSGAGLDLGVTIMPVVSETGQRLGPMSSYFGWAVSKQSARKPEAVKLAYWLTSYEVQKAFAVETFMVPVDVSLADDPEVAGNATLAAYLEQVKYGTEVPTLRATSMIFEQLDTALELTYSGQMDAASALSEADRELEKRLAE